MFISSFLFILKIIVGIFGKIEKIILDKQVSKGMGKGMKISKISTHRAPLMGFAMIMIIIFHSDIIYPHWLDLIKNFGDFGVNLFFAISGFSMCYAWKKNPDTKVFLKNRLLRILVTVLPVSILWNLFAIATKETTIASAVLKILTLQYWIDGNLFQWFVSAIIVFYLITPLWMKLYDRNRSICFVATFLIILISCIIASMGMFNHTEGFVFRIPAYFIGLVLGKIVNREKELSVYINIAFIVLLIISIVGSWIIRFDTLLYPWKYLIYVFLTLPVLFILAAFFDLIKGKLFYKICGLGGVITLETYLFQEKILKVVHFVCDKINNTFDAKNIIINIVTIILTIVVAVVYHKIVNKVTLTLRNKNK